MVEKGAHALRHCRGIWREGQSATGQHVNHLRLSSNGGILAAKIPFNTMVDGNATACASQPQEVKRRRRQEHADRTA
jgi:hypothetical protein